MQHLSFIVVAALRRTFEQLEEAVPDDPKVAEIKSRVLLRLAELQRRSHTDAQKSFSF